MNRTLSSEFRHRDDDSFEQLRSQTLQALPNPAVLANQISTLARKHQVSLPLYRLRQLDKPFQSIHRQRLVTISGRSVKLATDTLAAVLVCMRACDNLRRLPPHLAPLALVDETPGYGLCAAVMFQLRATYDLEWHTYYVTAGNLDMVRWFLSTVFYKVCVYRFSAPPTATDSAQVALVNLVLPKVSHQHGEEQEQHSDHDGKD